MKKTVFWALVLLYTLYIIILLIIIGQLSNSDSKVSYLEKRDSSCDVIHICFICLNNFCDRFNFYTTLKSLLAYRNNPLHFHVIVDNISERFTKVLFDTWSVSQVSINTYNVNNLSEEYRKILHKTQDVLIKEVPSLLHSYTSKVILIEANIFIEGDVYRIWRKFTDFRSDQVIGLLKPEDTAVVLMDVKAARKSELSPLEDYTNKTNLLLAFNKNSSRMLLHETGQYYINWNRIEDIENGTHTSITMETFISISKVMDGLPPRLPKCGGVFSQIYVHNNMIPECKDYPELQNYKRKTLPFLKKYLYIPKDLDVTLSLHLTYDKMPRLEEIATRWKGPISAGMYISEDELDKCLAFIEESIVLRDRSDVGYHVVFKLGRFYPINVMRNVALRNALTQYVFLSDVDFFPKVNLQDDLKAYIGKMETMNKKALVVPAFSSYIPDHVIPKTKEEWFTQWDNGLIYQFMHSVFSPGHGPTNYKKLRNAQEPYTVNWAPRYEPFVVLQKNFTEYDERFFGYGQNKIAHILTLFSQGYEFIVLPNTFIIHKYHNIDLRYFGKSRGYMSCLNTLKCQQMLEVKHEYGMKFNCEDFVN